MSKKHWIISVVVLVVVLAAAFGTWYYLKHRTPPVPAFPIAVGDTISSWNFKGGYSGDATSTASANADIAHLQSLMGKGQYDDYDLWVGIGNDENLLGDGMAAYNAYNHAIAIHPSNQGLAYDDLAHLMAELGAFETAKAAYAKAVTAEPGQLEYDLDRLTFLTQQFPNDSADILAAFTDAANQFGDTAQTLTIEAEWLTGEGKYADAIAAWQRVELLSPGTDHTSIDAEIARLQAKL